eukprot:788516-Rhodomonas_salina.6
MFNGFACSLTSDGGGQARDSSFHGHAILEGGATIAVSARCFMQLAAESSQSRRCVRATRTMGLPACIGSDCTSTGLKCVDSQIAPQMSDRILTMRVPVSCHQDPHEFIWEVKSSIAKVELNTSAEVQALEGLQSNYGLPPPS